MRHLQCIEFYNERGNPEVDENISFKINLEEEETHEYVIHRSSIKMIIAGLKLLLKESKMSGADVKVRLVH